MVQPIDIGFRWYDTSYCLDFLELNIEPRLDSIYYNTIFFDLDHDLTITLDISIKLEGERIGLDAKLQLKVSGDIERCEIIKGSEKITRWASNEIM